MKKIDAHIHLSSPISNEEMVKNIRDMMARKGYEGVGLMCLSYGGPVSPDPGCNRRALELLKSLPGSFAFAALDHGRDFVEQAREYRQQGFCGIKLLEGKPSTWKHYGYGLDHPRFEPFFTYAEQEQLPLLLHNNDPAFHWQLDKMSIRAIENGWYYDATYPAKEEFDRILEGVLARHPRLKIALAHMGFYADRPQKARELMEQYPNLMLDITPALPIYEDLSNTDGWADFFRQYHTRLFYGTDADCDLTGFNREYNDKKTAVIRAFLEETQPRMVCGEWVRPVGLPPEMLENIYYNNIKRFIS